MLSGVPVKSCFHRNRWLCGLFCIVLSNRSTTRRSWLTKFVKIIICGMNPSLIKKQRCIHTKYLELGLAGNRPQETVNWLKPANQINKFISFTGVLRRPREYSCGSVLLYVDCYTASMRLLIGNKFEIVMSAGVAPKQTQKKPLASLEINHVSLNFSALLVHPDRPSPSSITTSFPQDGPDPSKHQKVDSRCVWVKCVIFTGLVLVKICLPVRHVFWTPDITACYLARFTYIDVGCNDWQSNSARGGLGYEHFGIPWARKL